MNHKLLASLLISLLLFSFISCEGTLGKVKIEGTKFVSNGKPIFMNGVNTPWDKWNDFGGSFSQSFWEDHFALLHSKGINSSRIWISCNGLYVQIEKDGKVIGPTEKFWTDVDTLFKIAEKNGIYIMATLMSFDNFKDEGQPYLSWRKVFDTEENIDSMVENYIVPFVKRYKNEKALWSIDLCNEPDWIYENDQCGKIDFDKVNKLFAKEAAAIHANSDILVTIGFGMIKYTSDKYQNNFGSSEYLQSFYNDKNAYLDFDSPHFYEWEAEWFGFPFDTDPVEFGLEGKRPAVIGEFPATGMTSKTKGSKDMSSAECYVNVYKSGWNGIMAWTSNGVDQCGKLDDFVVGAMNVATLMEAQK